MRRAIGFLSLYKKFVSEENRAVSYLINGQSQDIPDPIEQDGVMYVPLAKVVETLGGYVTWLNEAKTVSVELGDQTVELQQDNSRVTKDGGVISLAGAPFNDGGTIWVPQNFFSDALGCTVDISGADVNISSP
jgi:hypothetical protein